MIVLLLEQTRGELQDSVAGVSDQRAKLSPGAGRWSVLEIVEHLAVAEAGMFRSLEQATTSATSIEDKQREAGIAARMGNPELRNVAPERALPNGRFATLAQALGQFGAARERTIERARDLEPELYFRQAKHPLFGEVNAYELLLIMASHVRRHAGQIREIMRVENSTR
jgi:uncharacterized damage-inducible protein DinB